MGGKAPMQPPRATRTQPRVGLFACIVLLVAVGCKAATVELPDAAPSPQASAEPAPLANVPATTSNARLDAGPRAEPLRSDRPLPPDVPHDATRDTGTREAPKELAGYSFQAVLRTGEGPPASKGPEINLTAIDAARRKTEARMAIDASQTRARFVLSGGFVLPQGTQLRARVDRYGHLVVWPGESTYRVAEPGALRALLGERRLDVAPLSAADVRPSGEGARRLNMHTRRVEVSTRAANATLELASLRDAADGGVLVCRMLLDLMSASPSTEVCGSDDVPLHAELRWTTQGALAFDVTSIVRRADLPAIDLAAPPASATFEAGSPPAAAGETLVTKADLAAFRNAPVDVAAASPRDAQPLPPESGLVVINSSDELRIAWIDGVAVAWVAPGGREWLSSLVRGRYVLQWRTFLGDVWEAPRTISVPGSSDIGAFDPATR
ncbi:MAG: hypothetical protein M3O46_05820 [Myxococcota bacterium]|nr:hypothetical protein [Myxococcota bacterium]